MFKIGAKKDMLGGSLSLKDLINTFFYNSIAFSEFKVYTNLSQDT